MNLFGKARLAILAVSHKLLDQVIDTNSVEAVKQMIRDLEVNIRELDTSMAEARGAFTTASRERDRLVNANAELDTQINEILSDDDESNDHAAIVLQTRFDSNKLLLEEKQKEVEATEENVQALQKVLSNLKAKHQLLVSQSQRLATMERTAKAKENAADALRHATDISGTGVDQSVDNFTRRIQQRYDVADAKLDSAMQDYNTNTSQDVQLAQTTAALAARKKKIAEAKATQQQTAPAGS